MTQQATIKNDSLITRFADCRTVDVMCGGELLFHGCTRDMHADRFTLANCLLPGDAGATREINRRSYTVAASGGSVAVEIKSDGSYTITTIEAARTPDVAGASEGSQ